MVAAYPRWPGGGGHRLALVVALLVAALTMTAKHGNHSDLSGIYFSSAAAR